MDNVVADNLSRSRMSTTKRILNSKVFDEIVAVFGLPTIHLFASRHSRFPTYISWRPYALAVDAFTVQWNAFPQFSLIGKCLQKVKREKASGIIIAPLWTIQPWFVKLMELLVALPLLLPITRDLLTFPTNRSDAPTSQETKANCLLYFRKSLRVRGISPRAADIVLAAWRPSTRKQYTENTYQDGYYFVAK